VQPSTQCLGRIASLMPNGPREPACNRPEATWAHLVRNPDVCATDSDRVGAIADRRASAQPRCPRVPIPTTPLPGHARRFPRSHEPEQHDRTLTAHPHTTRWQVLAGPPPRRGLERRWPIRADEPGNFGRSVSAFSLRALQVAEPPQALTGSPTAPMISPPPQPTPPMREHHYRNRVAISCRARAHRRAQRTSATDQSLRLARGAPSTDGFRSVQLVEPANRPEAGAPPLFI